MAVWDIYHDEEFCGLDHDDYLTTCYTDAEKEEFVKSWCDRHAEGMLPQGDADFEAVSRTFRRQLSFVKKQDEDNPMTCSGGETLTKIKVSNSLHTVLDAVNKLIAHAKQSYNVDKSDIGIEIHESEKDYKVRAVALTCNFEEFQDGTKNRHDYKIEFYGY